MSYVFLHELSKRIVKTDSASRFFAFQSTESGQSNVQESAAKIFSDPHLPSIGDVFPGLSALYSSGYSLTTPRETDSSYVEIEVLYTRNMNQSQENYDEKPWEQAWSYSIESRPVNVQHHMRYDLKSSSFEPHVNTAGDFFEKPISTINVNDIITLRKDFLSINANLLWSIRGSVNASSVEICGRKGEMGQFLFKNMTLHKKFYKGKEFNSKGIAYYSLEIEIEFCDILIQATGGAKKGFYFTIPSVGAREIKETETGKVLTYIRIPRRLQDGTVVLDEDGEEVLDYVENWGLSSNGEALSAEVNESPNDKYMMGPYLAQEPIEWSFVNTLRIPKHF